MSVQAESIHCGLHLGRGCTIMLSLRLALRRQRGSQLLVSRAQPRVHEFHRVESSMQKSAIHMSMSTILLPTHSQNRREVESYDDATGTINNRGCGCNLGNGICPWKQTPRGTRFVADLTRVTHESSNQSKSGSLRHTWFRRPSALRSW